MKISRDVLAVAVAVIVGALYYAVVLQSPIVFGDEGFYASVGRYMAQTGQYPIHPPYYGTDIYHPAFSRQPVFFFLNAGAWLIAGELGLKALIPLFSVLAALMLYVFFRSLGRPDQGIAAEFVLLMLPGMATYGVLDYVETANVLFTIFALYFGYHALSDGKTEHAVFSGIFAGLALTTELTALFVLPILALWFLVSRSFGKWKTLLIIFAVAALVMAPYLARNLILYNGFCYTFLPGDCAPVIDVAIPHDPSLGFANMVQQTATNVGAVSFGVLNYFSFAWGWAASILLLFGIMFALLKREKLDVFVLVWLAFFLLLTIQQMLYGGRTEDIPRYTLFGYPALAAVAGMFVAEAFGWFSKKHIIIGLIVVAVLVLAVGMFGQEKLSTMVSVKAFSPGFFDGCKWIRANTPADSLLFTIYGHHTAYQCDRRNENTVPDKPEIQLTNNDTSYEHLKLHGFDYVFVQAFTISQVSAAENINPAFISYMDSSPHFKKVYDNTAYYGSGGVLLYQVL